MNTNISVRFLLMLICATALSFSVDSAVAQNVERWIHPGFAHDDSACSICGIDTYENKYEQNYANTLRETDVFQFFINDLYNLGNYAPDPQQLRTRVGLFRKYGIRVSAEATGLNDVLTDSNSEETYCQQSDVPKDPDSVAHASAQQDLAKMQGIYDASGKLDYLALNNPIARVLEGPYGHVLGCEFSLHDAIHALIIYMQDIHHGTGGYQGHPDIKIGMTVGFPNVNYQGIPRSEGPAPNIYDYNGIDYDLVLSQAVNDIRAAGETLWFLHADSPYNYLVKPGVDTQTYINRLVALQNQARGLHLRFGILFQSAVDVDPSDHNISDQAYADQTKEYIQRFQTAAGGNPDDFVIESCYNTPYYTYPETAQNSFMNLVLQVVPYWGYDHGNFRRLDPDIFNWREYLQFYPDVQSFVNDAFPNEQQFGAEWHWLTFGVFEGRDGSRPFFSQEYLAINPDLSYYSNNWAGAIDHYFLYGRNDPRQPRANLNCNNVYAGLNNVVGLNNGSGDPRFLCYEGRWYDSGWELNDPSWEFKAYNHQRVGHFECNLPYARWDYVP